MRELKEKSTDTYSQSSNRRVKQSQHWIGLTQSKRFISENSQERDTDIEETWSKYDRFIKLDNGSDEELRIVLKQLDKEKPIVPDFDKLEREMNRFLERWVVHQTDFSMEIIDVQTYELEHSLFTIQETDVVNLNPVNKKVIDGLTCHICLGIARLPARQCIKCHKVCCNGCTQKIYNCPTCRQPIKNTF